MGHNVHFTPRGVSIKNFDSLLHFHNSSGILINLSMPFAKANDLLVPNASAQLPKKPHFKKSRLFILLLLIALIRNNLGIYQI